MLSFRLTRHLRWHRWINTLPHHRNRWYSSVLCIIISLAYKLYSFWLLIKINLKHIYIWVSSGYKSKNTGYWRSRGSKWVSTRRIKYLINIHEIRTYNSWGAAISTNWYGIFMRSEPTSLEVQLYQLTAMEYSWDQNLQVLRCSYIN